MKLRYKLLDLRRQQKSYLSFLENPGEVLAMDQKLKLCREILYLQKQIEAIETLTILEVDKDAKDWEITAPSRSMAAQRAIEALKTKTLSPIPYAFSTWRR